MATRSLLVSCMIAALVGACGSNDVQPLPFGTGPEGGSSGGGASAGGGTGPGGGANPVTPTAVGGQYALNFGDVSFQVDPAVGARITTLALAGNNLLTGTAVNATNWGSTFWTSPQSAWKPSNWPPPAAIDNLPYPGGPNGTHLILNGQVSPEMGISVSKDFSADANSGWITLTYTIQNPSGADFNGAPWQVTRLLPGAVVFFPSGASMTPGPLAASISTSLGLTWVNTGVNPASAGKAYGDGAEGWIGCATQSGVLFLQKFEDVAPADQAPSPEGEIEVYSGAGLGYFELEVQGPYRPTIPAGGSRAWTVSWRVVRLPAGLSPAVGNQGLVDFARQQLL